MEILRKVMGPLETNSYLVSFGKDAFIIDPGFPKESVELAEYILEKGLTLKYIIATHGHFDHVLGIKSLRERLGYKPEFLIHVNDVELLSKAGDYLKRFFDIYLEPVKPDKFLFGGESLYIDEYRMEIIHTPGHTLGSICIYIPDKGVLFTGDTIFKGTIGRLDLPESNPDLFRKSVDRLARLPMETRIYPGHGDESILGVEFETNQSLRRFIGTY